MPRLIALAALGLIAAAPAPKIDCAQESARAWAEGGALFREQSHAAGRKRIETYAALGCASPEELSSLAEMYAADDLDEEAEAWFKRSVRALDGGLDVDAVRYFLGRHLWKRGKKAEALAELDRAAREPGIERLTGFGDEFGPLPPEAEEQVMTWSLALDQRDAGVAATTYRRIAAISAVQEGLITIRQKKPEIALEAFARAETRLSVSQLGLKVQVTVLRDQIAAHGMTGNLMHAVATAEQLFALCAPDAGGRSPCPYWGVAPPPFQSHFDQAATDDDRLVELHVKLVAKTMDRALRSVSWDRAGQRRASARDDDFVGFVAHGKHYAGAVGAEEDRVETERMTMYERARVEKAVKKLVKAGRYELYVKVLIAGSLFTSQLGIPRRYDLEAESKAFGTTLEAAQAGIEKAGDDSPTLIAFEVARRSVRLINSLAPADAGVVKP